MYSFAGAYGITWRIGINFLNQGWWMLMFLSWTGIAIGGRLWLLGRRFGFITPADLMAHYYDSEVIRALVAGLGFLILFPYAAIQFSGVGKMIESFSAGAVSYEIGVGLFGLHGHLHPRLRHAGSGLDGPDPGRVIRAGDVRGSRLGFRRAGRADGSAEHRPPSATRAVRFRPRLLLVPESVDHLGPRFRGAPPHLAALVRGGKPGHGVPIVVVGGRPELGALPAHSSGCRLTSCFPSSRP